LNYVHEDDIEYVKSLRKMVMIDHKPISSDYRIVRDDSKVRYVHDDSYIMLDENDNPIRMYGTLLDITQQKYVEEALIESENRARSIINQSPNSSIIYNPDGSVVSINQAFIDLWETNDEVVEFILEDYNVFEDKELQEKGVLDSFKKAFNGEPVMVSPVVYKQETADTALGVKNTSKEKWVTTFAYPVKNKDGSLRQVVMIHDDVTEKKFFNDELNRFKNLLQNIVDSMPSVLVGVDNEGVVTHWNQSAQKMVGISSEEATGKILYEIFPQLSDEKNNVIESIRDKKQYQMTKVIEHLDEENEVLDVSIYPLIANGVEGAVVRIDDITKRMRMEEMVIQSEKMLSVGGLAAGMAHEINNPLAGILQSVQVLKNRLSSDLDKNRSVAEDLNLNLEKFNEYLVAREIDKMIEAIISSGKRAAEIVENMMTFSRKSDSGFKKCSVIDLLEKTHDIVKSDYSINKNHDFKKIKIVKEYDKSVQKILCDGSKIQQVFFNILKNGSEAMLEKKYSKNENPRFKFRVSSMHKNVIVEIEDNGVGMDEDTQKRVFEPFYTTKPIGVGTGLGLSVSYFIVTENHKGSISVKSQVNMGSRFIITLPQEDS
jgi:PAS domain S-box-containing protein